MLHAPIDPVKAFPNHAIWTAPAMALCFFPSETLMLVLGEPTLAGHPTLWCVRDAVTGAHLKVWRAGGLTEYAHWFVAWIDGPRAPGSGRQLAELVCGREARGKLELLDELRE